VAVAVLAALALAGCQGSPEPDRPAPTSVYGCNHPLGGADSDDVAIDVAFDFDEDHHGFDEAVPVTMCMPNLGGPTLRITGDGPGLVVDPALHESEGPWFWFTVTVSPGSTAGLYVETLDRNGNVGEFFSGPVVVTDDTGWSFRPWGAAAG
jgi:hypothetical protein